MSIITLDGRTHGLMADPEKFREQRHHFEKKLQGFLEKFQDDIRESAVVKADIDKLKDTYHQRWNNECDVAEKRGMPIDRDAFVKQVDSALAQMERRRKYTGAITPDALEMIGFRRWSDGTFRTRQFTLEQRGRDWSIRMSGELLGDYNMPNLIRLMDALDIKSMEPLHEPATDSTTQPSTGVLSRLFNRA